MDTNTATRPAPRRITLSLAHPGQRVRYNGKHLTITRITPNGHTRVWVNAVRSVDGLEVPETFGAANEDLAWLLEDEPARPLLEVLTEHVAQVEADRAARA